MRDMRHMNNEMIKALALAGACAALPAWADDSARLLELERRLEASLGTIETLQKRLEQLERKDAGESRSAAAPVGDWGSRLDTVERTVGQIEAAGTAAQQADRGLALHGFADVGAGLRNKAAAGSAPRGFTLGTLDLYLTPQFGDHVKGLIEVAFEHGPNGGTAVDVERLQLGYTFSDALTVWAGRFHTPYGHWNTAFHHGAQFQTAVTRPRFLDFEDKGGFLPAHSVGLWGTGAMRVGLGRLGYDVYAVNGNRIKAGVLDFQASGSSTGRLGLGFRTQLALAGSGWTVGVHGLTQQVAGENADASASGRTRMNMLGAYAVLDDDAWEAMSEVYRFRNRDLATGGTGSHGCTAGYVQLGRNLNPQFTPYVRLERAALDDADTYFNLQNTGRSYRRGVAGLRYNVDAKTALKAEWMRTAEDGTSGTPSSIALQYAVRF